MKLNMSEEGKEFKETEMRKLMPIDLNSLNEIENKTSLRMKSDDPSNKVQSLLGKIMSK